MNRTQETLRAALLAIQSMAYKMQRAGCDPDMRATLDVVARTCGEAACYQARTLETVERELEDTRAHLDRITKQYHDAAATDHVGLLCEVVGAIHDSRNEGDAYDGILCALQDHFDWIESAREMRKTRRPSAPTRASE
jgi:hypothetical protein